MTKAKLKRQLAKFDDVAVENGHHWTPVCDEHKAVVRFRFLDNGPNGSICGLRGCKTEATYYGDFADGHRA